METLTTLDRAIRLQGVELFADLETEMLGLLASIADQVEVQAGQTIVEEGQPAAALYAVLEGEIEIRRGAAVISTIGPDDTVGNWALFDSRPSVVTAVAARDSSLLRIDREEFFELLADHGDVTRELFQALFNRVRALLSSGLGGSSTGPANPD